MLIGLIPLVHIENDLKNPSGFHNLLVARKTTTLQRSIDECVLFGCDVVYVFCGPFVQKYIKNKYSSYVFDLFGIYDVCDNHKQFLNILHDKDKVVDKFKNKKKRPKIIPIAFHKQSLPVLLYNPIKSQIITALFGAYEIHNTFLSLTRSIENIEFFVSFPQTTCLLSNLIFSKDGVEKLREYRERIKTGRIMFDCNGDNVTTGKPLPFSFDVEKLIDFRKGFLIDQNNMVLNKKREYKALREFSVFLSENVISQEKYFSLNSWVGYKNYLSNDVQDSGFDLFYRVDKYRDIIVSSSFDNLFPKG